MGNKLHVMVVVCSMCYNRVESSLGPCSTWIILEVLEDRKWWLTRFFLPSGPRRQVQNNYCNGNIQKYRKDIQYMMCIYIIIINYII